MCPPKSRVLVRESEYTDFERHQIIFAPILYCKMIQMDEDIIEAPIRQGIYFKTLFKKGVFEGVLRSTVVTGNKIVQWDRIPNMREIVVVSII